MQVSVHKKGSMDEEGIFLFLFILRKSFDWTVVQRGDCQICDIIHITFSKHERFNLQFRYQSSGNKYILTSFCRRPSQSCFFFFCRNKTGLGKIFDSHHQWALLVWDSFRGHLTDTVKDLLARRNVDIAVIPGGLTPVLQPLDKCINKPFKAKLRILYETRMVNGPFTYTLSGKKRAPSKELVLTWINRAWNEIPTDLIQKSFKSCGITNTLDGSGDDAVWDEENEEDNGGCRQWIWDR